MGKMGRGRVSTIQECVGIGARIYLVGSLLRCFVLFMLSLFSVVLPSYG